MNDTADQFGKRMLSYYFEQMIQQKGPYDDMTKLVHKHVPEEAKWITLAQLLQMIAKGNPNMKIVQSRLSFANKMNLRPSDKILPLKSALGNYLVYQTQPVIDTSKLSANPHAARETVPVFFAYLLTERRQIILLKAHIGSKKLVYSCSRFHDLYNEHKEYFIIDHLIEFLSLYGTEQLSEIYKVRDTLLAFKNEIKQLYHATVSNDIERALLKHHSDYKGDIRVQFEDNSRIKIQIGSHSLYAGFSESAMQPIQSGKQDPSFRTKSTLKGWNGMNLVIVKTTEPKKHGRPLYVFVYGDTSRDRGDRFDVFPANKEIRVTFSENSDGKYVPEPSRDRRRIHGLLVDLDVMKLVLSEDGQSR